MKQKHNQKKIFVVFFGVILLGIGIIFFVKNTSIKKTISRQKKEQNFIHKTKISTPKPKKIGKKITNWIYQSQDRKSIEHEIMESGQPIFLSTKQRKEIIKIILSSKTSTANRGYALYLLGKDGERESVHFLAKKLQENLDETTTYQVIEATQFHPSEELLKSYMKKAEREPKKEIRQALYYSIASHPLKNEQKIRWFQRQYFKEQESNQKAILKAMCMDFKDKNKNKVLDFLLYLVDLKQSPSLKKLTILLLAKAPKKWETKILKKIDSLVDSSPETKKAIQDVQRIFKGEILEGNPSSLLSSHRFEKTEKVKDEKKK